MFKKKIKSTSLVCPDCDHQTEIDNHSFHQCSSPDCDTSFKGMLFKRKKFLTKATAITVLSGAISGTMITETIEDERLAYGSEFILMSSCINEYGRTVTREMLPSLIAECSCAIRNTVNDLGIDSDSDDIDEVIGAFSSKISQELEECS
ncbi:hypothetical protein [Bermanella sp. R86510]|uniref:hypothetical protein n=1 Tax=unclassified Bermanella TaxID=2627862 RepID=UPI0037C7B08B